MKRFIVRVVSRMEILNYRIEAENKKQARKKAQEAFKFKHGWRLGRVWES